MNRKHLAILILVVAVIAAGAVYYHGGGKTPPGQPPLLSLTPENFGSLKRAFNAAPDTVRVLVLVSPT